MQTASNVDRRASEKGWSLVGAAGEDQPVRTIRIHGSEIVVGRWDDADLQLDFRGVSRRHAVLLLNKDQLFLRDLSSTNGTFVNGARVIEETALRQGDVVQFGNAPFRVTYEAAIRQEQTSAERIVDRAVSLLQFDRLMNQRAVVPHFQPIVAIADEMIVGFEVLARSHLVGLESAQQLFETASHVQQEVELSQLLREEGVRIGQTIGESLAFFLNTHPKELGDNRLLRSLRALRDSFPDLPLTLEIHEAAVTNSAEMSALRAELTTLSIRLAYDDFGAGQARLRELVEVPPDYLKFDRSLIQDIHAAPEQRQRMLATLSRMVADLGIAVLAEGVECIEEARVCHQFGFQLAQGYFFGRPDNAGTWRRTLARGRSHSITT